MGEGYFLEIRFKQPHVTIRGYQKGVKSSLLRFTILSALEYNKNTSK